RFSGSQRATAGDHADFTSTAFTVEAYIHVTTGAAGTQFIAGHFDSSSANQRSWALVIVGGKLCLYLSSTGTALENVASAFEIVPGKDYYVAASVNLTNTSTSGVAIYARNL